MKRRWRICGSKRTRARSVFTFLRDGHVGNCVICADGCVCLNAAIRGNVAARWSSPGRKEWRRLHRKCQCFKRNKITKRLKLFTEVRRLTWISYSCNRLTNLSSSYKNHSFSWVYILLLVFNLSPFTRYTRFSTIWCYRYFASLGT